MTSLNARFSVPVLFGVNFIVPASVIVPPIDTTDIDGLLLSCINARC